MKKQYDIAIIGAGPGGYIAAIRAAQLGLKTVCIDKRLELGGTCLNVGCIPSKALLHTTELLARLKEDEQKNGILISGLSFDFSQMMKHKTQIVNNLTKGIEGSFKNLKIDFIQGQARFLDSNHLNILNSSNHEEEIEASNILIATGSEPIDLPNLKFDEKQIISSTGALSLSRVPKRMIVIGAGSIGLELASVYNRLGAEVTIIEMLDRICFTMDKSISEQLYLCLKKQGIQFKLSTQLITAITQPEEIILTVSNEEKLENLSADAVLVAVGRKPYTKGMDLDKVGIQTDEKGFIIVDKAFRTTQNSVFAIGDVIRGPMLAHRASEEGVSLIEMIAKQNIIPLDYITIPNVIYTNPEAASIGLTEEEARDANLNIMIGKSQFKANPRARCIDEIDGFVKVIGESHTGRIIGLHILGTSASELIEEGMMAIAKQATLKDLAYAPHAHPTLSETIKEAALDALVK